MQNQNILHATSLLPKTISSDVPEPRIHLAVGVAHLNFGHAWTTIRARSSFSILDSLKPILNYKSLDPTVMPDIARNKRKPLVNGD